MGFQPHNTTNSNANNNQIDGGVNSPRLSANMTRRGHSFKRVDGGDRNHEVELQINSPRPSSACNSPVGGSPAAADASAEWWKGQGRSLRFRIGLGKDIFRNRPSSGIGIVDLGFRERKKVGSFLFLAFCSVCLMLGVAKIIAGGWLGFGVGSDDGDYEGDLSNYRKDARPHKLMHTRLLALAAHALAEAERKPEPRDTWKEVLVSASSWMPCADRRAWEISEGNNGYIIVSANGGISQQRVAICNAVAISRLLNATLVLPNFLHSSVWKDISQFSDIYQEDHFISFLKADIQIVKELPVELRSLDLEAIGSLVTDAEVMKESKPSFYLKKILPILLKNRVVHFVGFGNRLAFDPIPFELQRLRCRCNFHALQFVENIQKAGSLIVQRMHRHNSHWGPMERNLLGRFAVESNMNRKKNPTTRVSRYLAVHARFEIDMAAYSMCSFGGSKEEEEELEAYRAVHFPALTLLKNTKKIPSSSILRSEGKCPLTPEEAVLMLAALGFKRKTRVYIAAGADIYGGKSRMAALKSLYPNLATKESLLSSSEIEPFRNFSSQLAALDFIACSAADAFGMTDAGSQFSSLVQGYRMYYGGGKRPTIRPNKRRLASVFSKNATIEWRLFENSVRKATKQSKKTEERPTARSIYRHPRCMECMCMVE